MKFQSRKDGLFIILIVVTILLLILTISETINGDLDWVDLFLVAFSLIISFFLLWIFLDTSYVLDENGLRYKSGPIKGKIKLEEIKEVIKGKTMWAGLYKPATAGNGLIIKYNKYDEIYISPKTNELFIAELLELNNKIKISH